ncbi:MAG: hypothetical protein CL534_20285 [Ahrensia sp.]|nr:hypothetical protein [Ahrensia sp.]
MPRTKYANPNRAAKSTCIQSGANKGARAINPARDGVDRKTQNSANPYRMIDSQMPNCSSAEPIMQVPAYRAMKEFAPPR